MPLPGPPPRDIKDPRYEPVFVNVDPLLNEAIASAQLAGAVHAKDDALTKANEDNTPSMAGLKNGSDAQSDSANEAELKRLRMQRIHDLNQIGGLQEENALLTKLLDKLDEAIYFFDCTADTKKCNQRIDDIVWEYREYKDHE
jgi:hypothetical protein